MIRKFVTWELQAPEIFQDSRVCLANFYLLVAGFHGFLYYLLVLVSEVTGSFCNFIMIDDVVSVLSGQRFFSHLLSVNVIHCSEKWCSLKVKFSDIMELKTLKGLALHDILTEIHLYVHRGNAKQLLTDLCWCIHQICFMGLSKTLHLNINTYSSQNLNWNIQMLKIFLWIINDTDYYYTQLPYVRDLRTAFMDLFIYLFIIFSSGPNPCCIKVLEVSHRHQSNPGIERGYRV